MIEEWTNEFIKDLNIQFDNLFKEFTNELKKIHIKFLWDD